MYKIEEKSGEFLQMLRFARHRTTRHQQNRRQFLHRIQAEWQSSSNANTNYETRSVTRMGSLELTENKFTKVGFTFFNFGWSNWF